MSPGGSQLTFTTFGKCATANDAQIGDIDLFLMETEATICRTKKLISSSRYRIAEAQREIAFAREWLTASKAQLERAERHREEQRAMIRVDHGRAPAKALRDR